MCFVVGTVGQGARLHILSRDVWALCGIGSVKRSGHTLAEARAHGSLCTHCERELAKLGGGLEEPEEGSRE